MEKKFFQIPQENTFKEEFWRPLIEKLTLKGLIFMEDLLIVNISAKEIFFITGEA